ncbi:MAG: NHLP bacteriocin export ABC transporter permease/ATPase subunit [Peptococcaceae bacterium]|jgi:NHLM bacteriocin system ABC transporter ATP-binding protein|nr:NHLP bacteriocin export ABC transporter permease/ATPase subunit [Peptococcaceae bacterium]
MARNKGGSTGRSVTDLLALPESQRRLVQWLMRSDGATLAETAAEDGQSEDEVRSLLDSLVEQGFVQQEGDGGELRFRARLGARTGRRLSSQIWQATYQSVADAFDAEGAAVGMDGNEPLLLTDPKAVWLVVEGTVHVFSVPVEQGRPCGVRAYLFSAGPGDLLWGTECTSDGHGLLAVGVADTRARRLPAPRLRELAGQANLTAPILAGVETWITGLYVSVDAGVVPREAVLLAQGPETVLKAGVTARSKDRFVWVRPGAGRVSLFGCPDVVWEPARGYLPLASPTWLYCESECRLEVAETVTVLAPDADWGDLESFHQMILRFLSVRLGDRAGDERERARAREAADLEAMEQAVALLAAAADGNTAGVGARAGGDDLLAACRLVGEALGVAIVAPTREQVADGAGHLARIADASGLRVRQVLLSGRWWRQDAGPLLAYREADGRPVALVRRGGRYRSCDPAGGGETVVTRETAGGLSPVAHMFYPPLAERAAGIGDVLRLGFRGTVKDLWQVVITGMATGATAMLVPILTGAIFGSVIPRAQAGRLWAVTAALIAVAVASAAFQLAQVISLLRIEGRADLTVQAAVWDRLLALPVPFFRRYTAGDLAQRAMAVDAIRSLVTGAALTSIMGAVFSVFSYGLLFYYDTRLALFATVVILAAAAVTAGGALIQLKRQRAMLEVRGTLAGNVLQFLTGITKLRVAGAERRAFFVWARHFARQRELTNQAGLAANAVAAFQAALPAVAGVVIFAVLASGTSPRLNTGAFLAFNAAFGQLLAGTLGLVSALTGMLRVVPLYERLKPILEELPEVKRDCADPGELSGLVEFSHVSFRYAPDGPPVVDDVSFTARPGQFVAFVGPSGAGKSTIFRLLLGFETPERGSIYYDQQDLAQLDVRALRRQTGAVLQNGRLVAGDILRNITGTANLTLEDAWDAARRAGLDEDIRRMPMGMFTYIAEGGSTLSGGQRQRLLIARAIAARPRILLFDEATSALDNRTQAVVSESLAGLRATRIVIAHRLSTVRQADVIHVLSGGRIVQSGTFDELMGQKGLFTDLMRRQIA